MSVSGTHDIHARSIFLVVDMYYHTIGHIESRFLCPRFPSPIQPVVGHHLLNMCVSARLLASDQPVAYLPFGGAIGKVHRFHWLRQKIGPSGRLVLQAIDNEMYRGSLGFYSAVILRS